MIVMKPQLASHAVDGRNPANQLIGGLSRYLQGSIHPRWLGMGFPNHQKYDVCVQYKMGMCVYCNIKIHELHEPRRKPSYFPLYWLFNRDPYNGLL